MSRAQWTEQGERSTKYFFGLEKSKRICKLVNDYVELCEQDEISKHAVDFYRHLFRSTEPNSDSFSNMPVLDSAFTIGKVDTVNTVGMISSLQKLNSITKIKDYFYITSKFGLDVHTLCK